MINLKAFKSDLENKSKYIRAKLVLLSQGNKLTELIEFGSKMKVIYCHLKISFTF